MCSSSLIFAQDGVIMCTAVLAAFACVYAVRCGAAGKTSFFVGTRLMKKSTLISMFLAIGLVIGAAQTGTVFGNTDFETDTSLVPNPGDTDAGPPTGWEYDRYCGYYVDPWLMNVSAIGDGSRGDVGLVFGTWNADSAWDTVVAMYDSNDVGPGQSTPDVTAAATGGFGGGSLDAQLGRFKDPANRWANYAESVRESVEMSTFGEGVWTNLTWNFEALPGDPGVGMSWYHWLRGQSYDDAIVDGVNPIPEPTTICLLGLGCLILLRRRA
jgi:hypothetical protein